MQQEEPTLVIQRIETPPYFLQCKHIANAYLHKLLVSRADGPGFPPQVLEQVRPGYTTKLDGHGLGLVAAIANVQRLGGSMELENLSGALVTMKLPIVME